MIAALCVIVVIQCLAMRERRHGVKRGELEDGVVRTTEAGTEQDESGSDVDSKLPQVQVGNSVKIFGRYQAEEDLR